MNIRCIDHLTVEIYFVSNVGLGMGREDIGVINNGVKSIFESKSWL